MFSYNKIKIIFFLVLVSTLVSFCKNIHAQESDQLTKEEIKTIEKKEEDLKKLEEVAEAYQKIVDLKQKQQGALGSQLNIIKQEIGQVQFEIKGNEESIEKANEKIRKIEKDIFQKEQLIDYQKKILSGLVRAYYSQSKEKYVQLASSARNIFFSKDRLMQTGDKVKEILNTVKALREALEKDKNDLESEKIELVDFRYDLEEKKSDMNIAHAQKNSLLIQTKGEEEKYQKKLERVEKQKQELLGDIDELYNANFAEISALAKELKKPDSGLASPSWYYSQKDSRWKNKTIGNSNSLMKDYGCAVASVAMVFTYHGEKISPESLCKQPIFHWDLISWPESRGSIKRYGSIAHGGVSWSTIDNEIKKENPVIIYIRAGSGGGHYVVIHGKDKKGEYVVHDPYWGANIYLDSTIKLLSNLYKMSISKKSIDQIILYK